jgi:activator of HSP90 ATPase
MKDAFELMQKFPVNASTVYDAWLDSEEHTKMTGGEASCSNKEGEEFSAWDGYITGKNIQLNPYKKIIQTWRTSDFKNNDEDSELIIEFHGTSEGCELLMIHKNIPEGQPDYKQGWIDHYLNPMKIYFDQKTNANKK